MKRRELIKGGIALAIVSPLALTQTGCGVSKEKAVRYTGIAINLLLDLKPLLLQIGGTAIVALVDKALPVLEKLKKHLEDNDFPSAGNAWDTMTGILSQVASALLQLPASPTRNTIIGIVAIVQVTLRTVKLFIESETPPSAMAQVPQSVRAGKADVDAILAAFNASKF